jgi:hypothetical protein
MSVPNVVCSLQTIQRDHIKNCVIINPDSLNTLFKVAKIQYQEVLHLLESISENLSDCA